MSASTELLLEQIKEVEAQVAEARTAGSRNLVMLTEQLNALRKRLAQANEALTEGKHILKG